MLPILVGTLETLSSEQNHDVWTGYWPGIEYCYDTSNGRLMFDLNKGADRRMTEMENENN